MKYADATELDDVLTLIEKQTKDMNIKARVNTLRGYLYMAMDEIADYIAEVTDCEFMPTENMGKDFGGLLVGLYPKTIGQPCPKLLDAVDAADSWV